MNPQNQQIQQRFYITRQQLLNPMNGSIAGPPVYLTRTPYTIEYNVNVFPNGRSPAEAGRFLVFLQFKFPENLQIVANYNFIVGPKVQNFHHTYKSSSSFGGIVCSRQQLFHPINVLNGEKLFIELIGTVSVQRLSINPRLLSVRANMGHSALSSPSFSNSPKPKADLSYRMPVPPSIIYKEKSSIETPKTETEINIARILQNHLEEERRTPKTAETPKKMEKKAVTEKETPKTSTNDASKILTNDALKTSTNDENLTPQTPRVTIIEKAIPEAAAEVHETNVIEPPTDIHEPPLRSPEPHPNSETDKSDSQPNDSSSSTTTDEPSRNKRVRTRTSRYVEFVVEEDDLIEEPVTKKSRKRKSNISPNSNLDGNDEYIPPRRSKSVARTNTTAQTIEPKFLYDCKIEGIEKTFDASFFLFLPCNRFINTYFLFR
uniref:Uncharacterized protein n=1 Tax=Panagrolaimus davidi TaxID=227884 RepID=A0A914Q942_9BILA